MLKIYNSLTKKKEVFTSLRENEVRLYVCGMTVYDLCHLGHARSSMLVFDMVARYLRARGYTVQHVRNITDVDDKIIRRANEMGESIEWVTERFIQAMHDDELALGVNPPDEEPRATQFIEEMIHLIQVMVDKGAAYIADSGDVCFEVRKHEGYGKLSHRNVDDLRSGARVDVEHQKRDPLDFVLWKQAKPDEPHWDSPWGPGRPGWHIECSAMSSRLLGQPFDIHGGGMDLKFPHHENEIAQSEAAKGCEFARCWMHVGLLQIRGDKMAKSLKNFITIREALEQYSPELLRFFFLSSHYRSPINYTKENLEQAQQSLNRLYTALRGLELESVLSASSAPAPSSSGLTRGSSLQKSIDNFYAAMDDDFNTPKAFSVLFDMAHEVSRFREQGDEASAVQSAIQLKLLANILGILECDPEAYFQGNESDGEVAEIEALIAGRERARIEKNWSEADRIRDALLDKGIVLEDKQGQTIWRRR